MAGARAAVWEMGWRLRFPCGERGRRDPALPVPCCPGSASRLGVKQNFSDKNQKLSPHPPATWQPRVRQGSIPGPAVPAPESQGAGGLVLPSGFACASWQVPPEFFGPLPSLLAPETGAVATISSQGWAVVWAPGWCGELVAAVCISSPQIGHHLRWCRLM